MPEAMGELAELLSSVEHPLQRKLYFLGWLTRKVEERRTGLRPVLVGGTAVELYTGGNYSSVDIDLVFDSRLLNDILLPEGFRRDGRYWIRDDLDLFVECPGSTYPNYVEIRLENGDRIYVSSLEEMIVDRLNACKHWRSSVDCTWAEVLLASGPADRAFLKRRASEEDVADVLEKLGRKVGIDPGTDSQF